MEKKNIGLNDTDLRPECHTSKSPFPLKIPQDRMIFAIPKDTAQRYCSKRLLAR
jgi:hypothetical protein